MGVCSLSENYVRWTDEMLFVEEYYDLSDDPWETHNPYGPRPQTNAPEIDWKRYQKAWPKPYEKNRGGSQETGSVLGRRAP